jgi:hypothetical protein
MDSFITVLWFGSAFVGMLLLVSKGYAGKLFSALGRGGCLLGLFINSLFGLVILGALLLGAPLVLLIGLVAPSQKRCVYCRQYLRSDATVCNHCRRNQS